MDARGADEHRRQLVAPARNSVVEIGAGYGATFPHYPDTVHDVLAIEPDLGLRRRAARAAQESSIPITVHEGTAEAIPIPDASVDTVVSSLVLCSVSDQATALREIRRVLRPGGLLLFYEHVRSTNRLLAAVEDLATPAWGCIAGGCHPNRDTLRAVRQAGFVIERRQRFGFSVLRGIPRVAHVLAVARKPEIILPNRSEWH